MYKPWSVDVKLLRGLEHLEYVALNSEPHMLYELTKLPNLQQIVCIECYHNLTRKLMEPFSKMRLTELSFRGDVLTSIENGTFHDFKYLSVLNFAGAKSLLVDDVIDAMSTS